MGERKSSRVRIDWWRAFSVTGQAGGPGATGREETFQMLLGPREEARLGLGRNPITKTADAGVQEATGQPATPGHAFWQVHTGMGITHKPGRKLAGLAGQGSQVCGVGVTPLLAPWCAAGEVPTGVNVNLHGSLEKPKDRFFCT